MAKSIILKVCLEILLISITLFSTGDCSIANGCEPKSEIVEAEKRADSFEFTSASCNTSNPIGLVLKFESRNGDCINYDSCTARSNLLVNGKVMFDTCASDGDPGICYVFATSYTVLETMTGFGCKHYALRTYDQVPDVRFEYKTCSFVAGFVFNRTYIVEKPDPTTTPSPANPTTSENIPQEPNATQGSSKQVTSARDLASTTASTAMMTMIRSTSTTTGAEFIATTNDSVSIPGTAESATATDMFPFERILAIVFGALFLITLVALVVLAIKYRQLTSCQSESENTGPETESSL